MRRSTTKYLLSVGLLSLGSVALIPSCADNNSSLFIVGVIDIGASTCVAKPDTTVVTLTAGVLDVAFASGYNAALLIGNQLTQRGSREQIRTETSRISLRGAEVTVSTLDGKTLANFSSVGEGFVDAQVGDVPSYGVMSVNMLPSALTGKDEIRSAHTVLAKIRVFGDTLGNASITSNEFDFPITICEGCLVQYDSRDATQTAYMCSLPTTTMQTAQAAPCRLGQDQPFSCTSCSATRAMCRDPSLNPSYVSTP